jgi:hypothetical protein
MQTETNDALSRIVYDSGLSQTSAEHLVATFMPFFAEAVTLCEEAKSIVVTDATQKTEMKQAREKRLALRDLRINAEKARKALKEDSLRTGKAIDNVAAVISKTIEPVEARLEEAEKFAERAEAARKSALVVARKAMLAPYGTDTTYINLGDMPQDQFDALYSQVTSAHEAKIAAAKKAEEDRIAAEVARAAEEARVRAENERLRQEREAAIAKQREAEAAARKEAEARDAEVRRLKAQAEAERRKAQEESDRQRAEIEAKAKKEREAAEAVARKERLAREKLEAEKKAAAAAEAKRVADEAKKAAEAAAAPDREKLAAYANAVLNVATPAMSTKWGKNILTEVLQARETFLHLVNSYAADNDADGLDL